MGGPDYMMLFGWLSSIFDLLTFGALWWVYQAAPEQFRTGWFIESLLTELTVALVVRTQRPFYRSRPGHWLLATTVTMIMVTLVLPYLPLSAMFGLVPLPAPVMLGMVGLSLAYVLAVELAKRTFYARAAPKPID